MNLDKIKNLFKRNVLPQTKHETTFAFKIGNVDYYQFADFNNTPAMRGLKTMVFYEEMKMKCTVEFLRLHTEAIDNILMNTKKLNIYEIKKLNDQLKQRLDIALDTELVYKIASIVFFPKEENIEDYDYGFNAKKIAHWKKEGGHDFFLQQPLKQLLPILEDMSGNLKNYSQVIDELNQSHLESLWVNLPPERTEILKSRYSTYAAVTHQK